MAKNYTFEIERTTHGIDRYYVELWDDDDEPCTAEYALELVQNGEIGLDFHEDLDWGEFKVTDISVYDDDDETPIDGE